MVPEPRDRPGIRYLRIGPVGWRAFGRMVPQWGSEPVVRCLWLLTGISTQGAGRAEVRANNALWLTELTTIIAPDPEPLARTAGRIEHACTIVTRTALGGRL